MSFRISLRKPGARGEDSQKGNLLGKRISFPRLFFQNPDRMAVGPCMALGAMLVFFSCSPSAPNDPGPFVHLVSSASGNLDYSLDLGDAPRDVYFVFGNVQENPLSSGYAAGDWAAPRREPGLPRARDGAQAMQAALRTLQGDADASRALGASSRAPSPAPNNDAVGSRRSFIDHTVVDPITREYRTCPATCRWVSASGYVDMGNGVKRKLSIWVADADWTAAQAAGKVNQAMVDFLGRAFLGTAQDRSASIYSWVTNILGAEWGSPGNSGLIDEDDCITIFLYDIGADASPDSGIMGYFYAVNNWKPGVADMYFQGGSNGRIMFSLDSVMLANGDDNLSIDTPAPGDSIWSESDPMPQELCSTLAHEFQHMIHYYQKDILRPSAEVDPTWTDEMCSLVLEDLLADKLRLPGPRGVPLLAGGTSDYGAGPSGNANGRLPIFNYLNFYGIGGTWPDSGSEGAIPYSPAYAFGAYLARNYGGAEFLRRMLQTASIGQGAVEYAAAPLSGGADFPTLFRRWSAAVLLSDKTDAPAGFRYNSGGAFDSAVNGVGYKLGSINLWNYDLYASNGVRLISGPMVASLSDSRRFRYGTLPMGLSNSYWLAASGAAGKRTWTIDAPANSTLTVIVR
jgi:hypothetical protein